MSPWMRLDIVAATRSGNRDLTSQKGSDMATLMIAVVCAAGLVAAEAQGPAPAALDAAGRWEATFYTDEGPRPATMVLKKDGDKLTGSISSELGEAPIAGTQKGGDVSLAISADFGNGPITITMTGVLKGDVITGTADVGGQMLLDWGAKRLAEPAPATGATGGAVDVSGAWVLQVSTGAGSGTPTITLEQKGESLTGRYSGQLGEAPLTGTLKGAAITFQFPVDVQGASLTIVYTGTVEKDTMKGTVRLGEAGEGTFTGARQR